MGIFLAGSLIQTMILVGNEDYAFPAWHGTMLAIGAMLVSYIANVYGSRALPYWQNAVFAIHVAAYFAYIIPVWVSAPTATHSQVWTEFQNEGGWSNVVLAVLIGQLSGISNQVGIDTVSHLDPFGSNSLTDIRPIRLHTCQKKSKMPRPPFLRP